jgi:release factor glutamine methyltransferase
VSEKIYKWQFNNNLMKKFDFSGLKIHVPDTVYEPSEDSFLLANAASHLSAGSKVLEVGCGSGIASLTAAKSGCSVIGVDISKDAVGCATSNAKLNKLKNTLFFVSDLFENLDKKQKFDAILFNPPYLPTQYKDKLNGPLNHAFDGGKDGRKVLDVFLDKFSPYLKKGGCLLLLQSDLNGPIKTKRKLRKLGYEVEVVEKESFFFETVYVYRAIKFSL